MVVVVECGGSSSRGCGSSGNGRGSMVVVMDLTGAEIFRCSSCWSFAPVVVQIRV